LEGEIVPRRAGYRLRAARLSGSKVAGFAVIKKREVSGSRGAMLLLGERGVACSRQRALLSKGRC
jgi:hypothetical protein